MGGQEKADHSGGTASRSLSSSLLSPFSECPKPYRWVGP